MQKARFPAGDGGAADLLGAIGVWGPHDSIRLRQLGLTREFAPELEVCCLPLWASGVSQTPLSRISVTVAREPLYSSQQWQVQDVGHCICSLSISSTLAMQHHQHLLVSCIY